MAVTTAQAAKCAALLKDTPLFRGFSLEKIASLLQTDGIACLNYRAGQHILTPDAYSPCMIALLHGKAVVEKETGEGIMRMRELLPGSLFGPATLFLDNQMEYPTRITARKNTSVLVIPGYVLLHLLREDFQLTENYLRFLTSRIHFLNARIDELIKPTAQARLLLYLRQNAINGDLTISLIALAQALSISRATLYRALDALEREGYIKRTGRNIRMLDPV